MHALSRYALLLSVALFSLSLGDPVKAETAAKSLAAIANIETHFKGYGHRGAWLVKRDQKQAEVLYGSALAQKRLPPASTFKVLLALVALETTTLKSVTEVVPWDGRKYPFQPQWQTDMKLKEAMQSSSESYFRVLAGRIGRERLANWVARLDYGNGRIGPDVLSAWHDGVLTVSASEQLAFIDRLRRNDLPFKSSHLAAVKAVMLDSGANGVRIYGKTGTHFDDAKPPGTGWWIGWVETPGLTDGTSFVLQLELQTLDERSKRLQLGKELLRATGDLH